MDFIKREVENIFLGIGISGKHNLTEGLPFDVLGLMLEAEEIKRSNDSSVNVLIADEHAKTNGFSIFEIESVTQQIKPLIENIIDKLEFSSWGVFLGSELVNDDKYIEIIDKIPKFGSDYLRHQLADVHWFESERNVAVKIGWEYADIIGKDESFFDKMHCEFYNETGIEFVYGKSGRRLSGREMSPYLCFNSDDRLLLSENEDVSSKIKQANKKTTRKYFNSICGSYEQITGRTFDRNINLKQKMLMIYDDLFRL
jgi:hypothetical protein